MTKTSRKTSRKLHAKTTKDPRFNGIASFTSFAVILEGRLTQSLSNTNLRFAFVFFIAHPLNQASLFRGFALKKPVTFVTGFVARPGFEPGTSGL